MSVSYHVLFVCLGNICRSPAAEVVCRATLRRAGLATKVRVDSCGTASYHSGSRPDSRMIAALKRAGFVYDGHRARTLRAADGADYDLIIPQDAQNLRDVRSVLSPTCTARVEPMSRWFPADAGYREVPDPYYGTAEDFDDVVRLLAASMPRLVEEIRELL